MATATDNPKKTPAKKATAKPRTMSADHKAALAAGREEGRIVKAYLEAINTPQPRGRRLTPERIEEKLASIEAAIPVADPLDRLKLEQERIDLWAKRDKLTGTQVDLEALEAEFVKVAASYGDRKGLTKPAWRAVGVPTHVLRQAGIK